MWTGLPIQHDQSEQGAKVKSMSSLAPGPGSGPHKGSFRQDLGHGPWGAVYRPSAHSRGARGEQLRMGRQPFGLQMGVP